MSDRNLYRILGGLYSLLGDEAFEEFGSDLVRIVDKGSSIQLSPATLDDFACKNVNLFLDNLQTVSLERANTVISTAIQEIIDRSYAGGDLNEIEFYPSLYLMIESVDKLSRMDKKAEIVDKKEPSNEVSSSRGLVSLSRPEVYKVDNVSVFYTPIPDEVSLSVSYEASSNKELKLFSLPCETPRLDKMLNAKQLVMYGYSYGFDSAVKKRVAQYLAVECEDKYNMVVADGFSFSEPLLRQDTSGVVSGEVNVSIGRLYLGNLKD